MQEFLLQYPMLIDILIYMSIFRMIFKPLLSFAYRYVKITDTKEDDKWLNSLINSPYFLIVEFILDLLLSIKLPRTTIIDGDK